MAADRGQVLDVLKLEKSFSTSIAGRRGRQVHELCTGKIEDEAEKGAGYKRQEPRQARQFVTVSALDALPKEGAECVLVTADRLQ